MPQKRVMRHFNLFVLIVFMFFTGICFSMDDFDDHEDLIVEVNLNWLPCHIKLDILFNLLEKKDYNKVINISKKLIQGDWGEDKMLLYLLSSSTYLSGNLTESIEYLERSLKSDKYYCEIAAPLKDNKLLNESELRYILGELYSEKGLEEKSVKELKLSKKLAKKHFGSSFNEQLYKKIIQPNIFSFSKKNDKF